eukprot:SAG22_NODE_4252_length_1327_cov_1.052117_1_plen_147_part_10
MIAAGPALHGPADLVALCAVLRLQAAIWVGEAVQRAPNPGFAKMIVNLNTVWATIASPFLFGSRLSLANAGGVALSMGESRSSLSKAVITQSAFPSVSLPFLAVPLRSHRTVAISWDRALHRRRLGSPAGGGGGGGPGPAAAGAERR